MEGGLQMWHDQHIWGVAALTHTLESAAVAVGDCPLTLPQQEGNTSSGAARTPASPRRATRQGLPYPCKKHGLTWSNNSNPTSRNEGHKALRASWKLAYL